MLESGNITTPARDTGELRQWAMTPTQESGYVWTDQWPLLLIGHVRGENNNTLINPGNNGTNWHDCDHIWISGGIKTFHTNRFHDVGRQITRHKAWRMFPFCCDCDRYNTDNPDNWQQSGSVPTSCQPHELSIWSRGRVCFITLSERGTGLMSELWYEPKQRMPSSFIRFCLVKTKEPNYLMAVCLMSALVTQCPVIGGSLLWAAAAPASPARCLDISSPVIITALVIASLRSGLLLVLTN